MPVWIPGKSRCPLCGEVMEHERPRIGFPSFLKRDHSLAALSDAVVHRTCFDAWEHHDIFLSLWSAFEDLMETRPRTLDWHEGEEWLKSKGEEFGRYAAALDPANQQKR